MCVAEDMEKFTEASSKVLSCRSTLFHPLEFSPCKECQFQMASLSFKENTEYEIILSKLKLDVNRKRWIAAYPFNMLVGQLIDNYSQAKGYETAWAAPGVVVEGVIEV
jgi:hypothetical protein